MRSRSASDLDKDETEAGSDYLVGEPVGGDESVTSVFDMKKQVDSMSNLSQYKSAVLYGSMKEKDKLETMERFIAGDIKILISTTVIEVGVDNPNANVMIIMDADRFGLSTLHQLRGRIGRGDKKSYCLLVSESRSELALSRMKMMCESSDGFELAEKDLELRGPGDFYGTRQHGIPTLRAANLYTDMKIATEATEATVLQVLSLTSQAEEECDFPRSTLLHPSYVRQQLLKQRSSLVQSLTIHSKMSS